MRLKGQRQRRKYRRIVSLNVESISDRDIGVSNPPVELSATYRKDGDAPLLVATDDREPFSRIREGAIIGASVEGCCIRKLGPSAD